MIKILQQCKWGRQMVGAVAQLVERGSLGCLVDGSSPSCITKTITTMQLLRLNTPVSEIVTDSKGVLTHAMINMDHNVEYVFQPAGIDIITRMPKERIFVESARIVEKETEEVDVPLHLLGTDLEEMHTGYKGICTKLIVHLGGCIHVDVTPKGRISAGQTRSSVEFDIRRIKPTVTEETAAGTTEVAKQAEFKPSPSHLPQRRRMF